MTEDRWILDRPNSYIGRSVPRPDARRLTHGRGTFVDDIVLPRMVHAAFVRSPHAHARIVSIDTAAAEAAPGVVAVVTGEDLARIHDPWVGVLTHLEGLKSAPQHALPVDTARWQGEAVVAVVAERREQAEDAAELVGIEWEALPAATDMETALDPETRRSSMPSSATTSPGSGNTRRATSTPPAKRPTRWSRRPTISAGTPA